MRIAIVGSGIAGNTAASLLHPEHDITVFEAAGHVGGHSHTHQVHQGGRAYSVDTGFIVFNDRTYPHFSAMLERLRVGSRASTMSFSVSCEASGLEYNGTSLDTLFAQRRNVLRPRFLGMVRDILRFNREAPRLLEGTQAELPLGDWLERARYGAAFVRHYVIPMGAAIWSTSPGAMLDFPARFFIRFLMNHGMLSIDDRPTWRTVVGGSARYVEALTAPFRHRIRTSTPVASVRRAAGHVMVRPKGGDALRFDALFLACHSDQSLALLEDPTDAERNVLRALPYQRNEAVLHTDARLMPRNARARAAWNYHVPAEGPAPVALTYDMNRLQGLDAPRPFLVTLNRTDAIEPSSVIARMGYDHPLFTPASISAQARHAEVNRGRRTYYCGAYWRHGFHEDGVLSAMQAVRHFREDLVTHAARSAA